MVVSRRRSGACVALRWDAAQQRYHCGMVVDPGSVIGWRNAWVTRALRALAWRWIAAGAGCDAEPLMVETSSQRDAR